MCVCRFWLAKRDRDFYGVFYGKLEGLEQILTFKKFFWFVKRLLGNCL